MENVVIIPARGGSKGLPQKNIKALCGKPLIAWTIESALSSSRVDSVYVSTDCPEIANVARSFGAKVPFLRPASLSNDNSSTESAITHFCEWIISNNINIDNVILLQPTSPIRCGVSIDDAILRFEKNSYDSLLSVNESHCFFWKKNDQENPVASYDYTDRPRRQDISDKNKKFLENGSIYIFNFNGYIFHKNRLFGRIGMFEMKEIESYEIDTEIDFIVCEALLRALNRKEI